MESEDPDVRHMPNDRVVLLFIDGPAAGHLMSDYSGVAKNVKVHVLGVGWVKYRVHVVEFDGRLYAVAALGELPPIDVLTRSILNSRLPPCGRAELARPGGYIHKNTPPAGVAAVQIEPLPPDLTNQPKPDATPPQPPAIREDGWYWVQILLWSEDEWSDWAPALWSGESRSWRSAGFSGVPDSHVRVIGRRMGGYTHGDAPPMGIRHMGRMTLEDLPICSINGKLPNAWCGNARGMTGKAIRCFAIFSSDCEFQQKKGQ